LEDKIFKSNYRLLGALNGISSALSLYAFA
jgi:hypothetical protein